METRTPDLVITSHALYQLSYSSCSWKILPNVATYGLFEVSQKKLRKKRFMLEWRLD